MGSFGETLRRERELREISLREIADATKINIRYLEALEQNRFDILPGGVFNKGFIRAYARFIGADSEALVDGYLQAMAAREAAATGMSAAAGATGLHRPPETPRRRAGESPGSAGVSGNGRQPLPSITFAENSAPVRAAEPPAPVAHETPVPRQGGADPLSAPRQGSRSLVVIISIIAVAVVVLAALLGVRSMRSRPAAELDVTATPAPDTAPAPAQESSPPPAEAEPAGAESAAPGDDATGAPSATEDARPRPLPPGPPASDIRTTRPLMPEPGIASPIPPPAPNPETAPAGSSPAPGRTQTMEFRIEAAAPVWVQVSCDGEDRLNRSLQAGEGLTLRCLSLIRISATDAGAVRLTVNGARCAAIGEHGARVEGFAIRSEDYQAICPPGGNATDGRP